MGNSEGRTGRKVHNNTGLPKEDRKISNKQPTHTPKELRKTMTKKAQSKQNEGNNQEQSRNK